MEMWKLSIDNLKSIEKILNHPIKIKTSNPKRNNRFLKNNLKKSATGKVKFERLKRTKFLMNIKNFLIKRKKELYVIVPGGTVSLMIIFKPFVKNLFNTSNNSGNFDQQDDRSSNNFHRPTPPENTKEKYPAFPDKPADLDAKDKLPGSEEAVDIKYPEIGPGNSTDESLPLLPTEPPEDSQDTDPADGIDMASGQNSHQSTPNPIGSQLPPVNQSTDKKKDESDGKAPLAPPQSKQNQTTKTPAKTGQSEDSQYGDSSETKDPFSKKPLEIPKPQTPKKRNSTGVSQPLPRQSSSDLPTAPSTSSSHFSLPHGSEENNGIQDNDEENIGTGIDAIPQKIPIPIPSLPKQLPQQKFSSMEPVQKKFPYDSKQLYSSLNGANDQQVKEFFEQINNKKDQLMAPNTHSNKIELISEMQVLEYKDQDIHQLMGVVQYSNSGSLSQRGNGCGFISIDMDWNEAIEKKKNFNEKMRSNGIDYLDFELLNQAIMGREAEPIEKPNGDFFSNIQTQYDSNDYLSADNIKFPSFAFGSHSIGKKLRWFQSKTQDCTNEKLLDLLIKQPISTVLDNSDLYENIKNPDTWEEFQNLKDKNPIFYQIDILNDLIQEYENQAPYSVKIIKNEKDKLEKQERTLSLDYNSEGKNPTKIQIKYKIVDDFYQWILDALSIKDEIDENNLNKILENNWEFNKDIINGELLNGFLEKHQEMKDILLKVIKDRDTPELVGKEILKTYLIPSESLIFQYSCLLKRLSKAWDELETNWSDSPWANGDVEKSKNNQQLNQHIDKIISDFPDDEQKNIKEKIFHPLELFQYVKEKLEQIDENNINDQLKIEKIKLLDWLNYFLGEDYKTNVGQYLDQLITKSWCLTTSEIFFFSYLKNASLKKGFIVGEEPDNGKRDEESNLTCIYLQKGDATKTIITPHYIKKEDLKKLKELGEEVTVIRNITNGHWEKLSIIAMNEF
jgi:hypothetical protein